MNTRPINQLKNASMWAAALAIVAETGLKNIMMTTLVTVGTPATATGFVYEIVQMRNARLDREAADRAHFAAKSANPPPDAVVVDVVEKVSYSSEEPAAPVTDLSSKIAAMLIEREQFVDIYGGSAEAVAPSYWKIAKIMLDEDDRIFAKLAAEKQLDPIAYDDRFGAAETALRTVHGAMRMLTPDPMR